MNPSLETLLALYKGQRMPDPEQHPELESIIGFVDETISPRIREEVLGHLEYCKSCGDLVLALKTDQHPAQGTVPQADEETAFAWSEFQKMTKLIASELPSRPENDPLGHGIFPPKPFWRRLSTAYGLVAILLVATLFSVWRMVSLDVAQSSSATFASKTSTETGLRANPEIISLFPIENRERIRTGPINHEPDYPMDRDLTIVLTTANLAEYAHYAAHIQNLATQESWEVARLERKQDGSFRLHIPPNSLPPGRYLIETRGKNENEWTSLENYSLTIRSL